VFFSGVYPKRKLLSDARAVPPLMSGTIVSSSAVTSDVWRAAWLCKPSGDLRPADEKSSLVVPGWQAGKRADGIKISTEN